MWRGSTQINLSKEEDSSKSSFFMRLLGFMPLILFKLFVAQKLNYFEYSSDCMIIFLTEVLLL